MVGIVIPHAPAGVARLPVQHNGIGRRVRIQHLAVQRPAEARVLLHRKVRFVGDGQPQGGAVALVAQQRAGGGPVVVGAVVKLPLPGRRGKGFPQVRQPVALQRRFHLGKYRILVKQGGVFRQLIPQDTARGRHRQEGHVLRCHSAFGAPVKELPQRLQVFGQPFPVQVVRGHLFDVVAVIGQVHPADIPV